MNTHEEYERQDHFLSPARGEAENMQAQRGAAACFVDSGGSDFPGNSRTVTREAKFAKPPEIKDKVENDIFPRFDWYQATISKEVEPFRVLRWAQFFGDPHPHKPFHGYDDCFDFGQLKILFGGPNGQHGVHVIIHGGDACQRVVESFRKAFPEHYPTRIDVCFDFRGHLAFEKLYALAVRTKRKFNLQGELRGDWLDKLRGRSFYLGGKKSTYRAVVYEKGHQLRQEKGVHDAPLDWVRVEFRIAPTKESKLTAAGLLPEEVARSGRWTEFFCGLLGAVSVPRVKLDTRNKKPRSVESCENMFRQYAAKLWESVEDGFLTRQHHHDALDVILDGKQFQAFPEDVYREWYF